MNILIFWFLLIFLATLLALILFWPLRKSSVLFICALLAFNGLAVGLYYYWGSAQSIQAYFADKEKSQQVKKMLKRFKNTKEIIEAMKIAIAKNPNKAKGWYLLGQLYRSENDLSQAIPAFQKAYQLNPSQFNYTFAYLQVLYKKNNEEYTPEISSLMQKLKEHWPNNPELLDFLGYDAYMHGDYAAAVTYWEKLLPYLLNNPKEHKAVLMAIGKAEKKLLK